MYKKLLSNLPFNPSLISQVAFYAKRLRKESSIRRTGFILMSLTFAVQAFAVIAPAEASNQCSSNDVIRCGFKSQSEAVQRCNANTAGFGSILNYYGISCEKLASAQTQTIPSNAFGNSLYSMGRNPYNKPGEYGVDIPSAGHYYLRPLSSWGNTSYKMLVTKTTDNKLFMVMYSCGNIVIEKGYTPPAKEEPPSLLKLAKVNNPTGTVKPGDIIDYTLAFSNTGGNSAFFSVNDKLPNELEYISSEYGNWKLEKNGNELKWFNNTPPFYTFGNTDALGTPGFIKLKAKVKPDTPSGTVVCNKGWLIDVNIQTKQTQTWSPVEVCNTVLVECPEGTIPKDGKCVPPEEPTPEEPKEPILAVEKKAKNLTQNIDDANNTTANAGDTIEYTLTTNNFGDGEAKDIILKPESLADILEYANLDLNSLGDGVYDTDSQTIAWNKPVTIKSKESITKTFKVTVKNPVPKTPSPHGNPGSFDLMMTNVYGNTINIKLPKSVTKTTEEVNKTLPNTGPGEALLIGTLTTSFIGYFFARSKLMTKELELVKQEYVSGS
jgi:uncharacterized repeat protein (TIGR01451 family)